MNNKNNLFKKNEKFPQIKLDWSLVQSEMKIKLGKDIYESWLKNLILLKSLAIMYFFQFHPDLFAIGLHQDI